MFFYLCTFNKKIRQECTHVLWDFFVKKIDLIDGSTHGGNYYQHGQKLYLHSVYSL